MPCERLTPLPLSMEQSSNELVSYPPELVNELGSNSDSGPNTQAHHDNSELPINKVIPDILYNIFILAVYDSNPPEKTTLNISHVCRHWRKSSLEWPALWAFIDLKNHPPFVDLFMKRSGDAPLTLTWNSEHHTTTSSETYFFSHASIIIPRLCSLTLCDTWPNLIIIHDVIEHSRQSLPLQLRRLDINIYVDGDYAVMRSQGGNPPSFTNLVDVFYLRELFIHGMNLPWLELPHRNLTQFTIRRPINLPPFSQLLVLLSNCPLLEELILDLNDHAGWEIIAITSPSVISNKLDFPCLTELSLFAAGKSSCCYIQQFSRHLQPLPGSLSQYKLRLYYGSEYTIPTLFVDILDTIPSGIFSHHHYLSITRFNQGCTIYGDNVSKSASGHRHSSSQWPAFEISEICGGLFSDYSLILRLAHAMPRIEHLKIQFHACQLLAQLDINDAFPCLHTLELDHCGTEALNTLSAGVNLKTLILRRPYDISSETLYDLVLRMGIDVLEVEVEELNEWTDAIIALRSEGVVVRVSGPVARV